MSYHDAERTKLRRQSSKDAITLAMQGRWREAVALNKELLENFPNDVDAYNRLGRAHMELGEYNLAREAYQKTTEIDPYNSIAQKNLNRLSHLNEAAVNLEGNFDTVEPQQFIEEVGKAGVVDLSHLAPPGILAKTVAGDKVNLKIDGDGLVVENSFGEYIGTVEPGQGQRLIRLINGGNRYAATIISSILDAVTVMIREVYQDPSQADRFSFPPKGSRSIRPLVDDRVIRRELEHEEALTGELAYTIVGEGEDETELYSEQSGDDEEDEENEM